MPITQKNPGPLLIDKLRGFYDQLPDWLRAAIPVRLEKQKVDARTAVLDALSGARVASQIKQEQTDEVLKTNTYLDTGTADGSVPPGFYPKTHPGQVVLPDTGQVGTSNETVSDQPITLVPGPPLQTGSVEQVGGLYVSKTVSAPTFDKVMYQQSKDDLLPAEFRASIPEKAEQHTVDGTAALPTLGPIDLVRRETQEKVGVKTTLVQSRDTTGTKPTLVGQRVDPEFNGATLNLAKSVVPETTVISQPFGVTDAKIIPYDDKNAVRETWTVNAAGFPQLTQYNYDPELNTKIGTQLQIVSADADITPVDGWVDYSERKIDSKHKLRVVNFTAVGPPTETTYETRQFTFPGILWGLDFKLVLLAATNRSSVQWSSTVRAAYTAPVPFRTVTSYFWSPPAPSAVVYWVPGDIIFKGISYTVSISNVLFNTWSNIGVSYTNDAYYGNAVDRFSITKTFPDVNTYYSWIGTQQCISSVVSRYKRMWVRKDTYVTIQ